MMNYGDDRIESPVAVPSHRTDISEADGNGETTKTSEDDADFLQQLVGDSCSYGEKMHRVACSLYNTAFLRIHKGGYSNFDDLDRDSFADIGVSGTQMAETMGYTTFKKMCLNAPEIVELFTWERETKERNGRTYHEYSGFRPRVTKEFEDLHRFQMQELRETSGDLAENYVAEQRERGDFPTDAELDFRLRLCETLDQIGGLTNYIHYSPLQKSHERMHGEPLNMETYRKYFPFGSQFTMDHVKARMSMELCSKPSKDKKNFEFCLHRSLDDIRKCYDSLRAARRQHEADNPRSPTPNEE